MILHLKFKPGILLALFAVLSVLAPHYTNGQAIKVEVKKVNGQYTLIRGGEPYYIKGAGGSTQIDELIALGGNSIRTWGIDEADEALEKAEKHGLTVMLGLWVQHERHGFDYNDEEAVQAQLERFTEIVKKYKDHPSILLWGIGNEVDLFYSNKKVWDAIQDIAKMIHEIDPNHPTSTVTAGLEEDEVKQIKERAPDIDIYGINTYGDIAKISENLSDFGWDGPYIVSEWGPNGHWEVPKTTWGAPIEQTSTEKAASYAMRFDKYISQQREQCIGSYVFLWGQKQETTSTWYGLFTEKGNPTEPLDELHQAWKGKPIPNKSPEINEVKFKDFDDKKDIRLKAGDTYELTIDFKDPEGDRTKVWWAVYPESSDTKAGGDFESSLQPVLGTFTKRKKDHAVVRAPEEEGAYRVFVYVQDKHKRTAYANIPFYVYPRSDKDPNPNWIQIKERELKVDRN
jgi:hypothetical protein